MNFKNIKKNIKRIIISRTDAIGDVILCLPMVGVLKTEMPDVQILFLGRNYTKAIINQSKFVDKFISWDDFNSLDKKNCIEAFKKMDADAIIHVFPNAKIAQIAKQAKIPYRLGTYNRMFHWTTCNIKIHLSRKRSTLHESQSNLKLLEPFGINTTYNLDQLPFYYGFSKSNKSSEDIAKLLSKDKFNLILHAKSNGSAKEWGIDNYLKLIEFLPASQFKIFISGTNKEKESLSPLRNHQKTVDVCSLFNLEEFIQFIALSDGLVAASTGPLHIAAAFGKKAIGLYPVLRAMHPRRWSPLGSKAEYLVYDNNCADCLNGKFCLCIQNINPKLVAQKLYDARKIDS